MLIWHFALFNIVGESLGFPADSRVAECAFGIPHDFAWQHTRMPRQDGESTARAVIAPGAVS